MKQRIRQLLKAVVFSSPVLFPATIMANDVFLTGPQSVNSGESFNLYLAAVWSESPLSGGFDLAWDADILDISNSVVVVPGTDPAFTLPGTPSSGDITGICFGSFLGFPSGSMDIARLTFEALAPGDIVIDVTANSGVCGPPISATTFNPLSVTYHDSPLSSCGPSTPDNPDCVFVGLFEVLVD